MKAPAVYRTLCENMIHHGSSAGNNNVVSNYYSNNSRLWKAMYVQMITLFYGKSTLYIKDRNFYKSEYRVSS